MNPFKEAKSQGYSDAEIFEYLADHPEYSSKIQSAREEGYNDKQIAKFLSAQRPKALSREEKANKEFEGLSRSEIAKKGREKGVFGPTDEQEAKVKSSVISGLLGTPRALLGAPKAIADQAYALISGEEPGEESYSDFGKKAFGALDTAASYFPDPENVRRNLGGGEEMDLTERVLQGVGGGALVGAPILGGAFGALESGLENVESPRLKAAARLGLGAVTGLKGKKGLQPTAKQKPLFEFLKKSGLEDSQIALALEKPGAVKQGLAKLAKRGSKTDLVIESARNGLESVYENLAAHPSFETVLAPFERSVIENELYSSLEKFPVKLRKQVLPDVQEFINGPQSFGEAVNLWQDINANFGSKSSRAQILKKPLLEAMEKIDPSLTKDFQMANEAYGNFASVRKNLKPETAGFLTKLVGPSGALVSLVFGNPWLAAKHLGLQQVSSLLAREMVLNPKLKNISQKLSYAINKKSLSMIKKQRDELADEIEKVDPQVSEELRKADPRDFID